MSNIAISVRHLTKTYKLYNKPIDRLKEALNPLKKQYHKNFNALDNVSFEIVRGETVGIIGRNGSGKSTLLKLITGVLTPTAGRVIVHGRLSAILELGSGFNGEMTGLENIYLNNMINGISESETKKRLQQIAEFAELGDFIHQPLKTYSSGMKARLAFAVAINVEPDILIVDEALSVGDAAFQRKCFAKMEQIRKAGATILFVSHSEASIVNLCNRAIWLVNGEKVLDGEPKLVTSLYLKHINNRVNLIDIAKEYADLEAHSAPHKNDPIVKTKQEKGAVSNSPNLTSYNSNLKPSSTIKYKPKGAEIYDVRVTTLQGELVNILEHGKEYFYSYKLKVTEPLNQVNLGFLIKQKNGTAIGGGIYPSAQQNIDEVSKNIQVQFKIKCELASGEYFFNAGVLALKNGKQEYVHRILDAYMIKVINSVNNMTGIVKLIESADYQELS